MPMLMHPAQSGFIKGRSATLNIRKAITALEYAKAHPGEDVIMLTLDAEKTFDNVNLKWLFRVMGKMGFQGTS